MAIGGRACANKQITSAYPPDFPLFGCGWIAGYFVPGVVSAATCSKQRHISMPLHLRIPMSEGDEWRLMTAAVVLLSQLLPLRLGAVGAQYRYCTAPNYWHLINYLRDVLGAAGTH